MEQCHRTSSRRNAACRAHLSSISLGPEPLSARLIDPVPRHPNFSTRPSLLRRVRVHRVYLDRAAAPNGILCHARHFSLSLSLRGYTRLNSWPKISSIHEHDLITPILSSTRRRKTSSSKKLPFQVTRYFDLRRFVTRLRNGIESTRW